MEKVGFVHQDLDENLMCTICFNVMCQPRSCMEGHAFCSKCISEWLRNHHHCPIDRGKLSMSSLTKLRPIENIIDEGASGAAGCPWTGKLADQDAHVKECLFLEVECPFKGCTSKMLRSELSLHLQSKSAEHLDLARARIDTQDVILAQLQATVGELKAQMARNESQSEQRTTALALRVKVLEQEAFKARGLVPGTIQKLADNTLPNGAEDVALLQVIGIHRMSGQSGMAARYRLTVSDSQHSMLAMLATQLNGLVDNNTIAQHTVIGIQDFLTNNVNGRKIVIILSLKEEAFCQPEGVIGAPTALPAEQQQASPGQAVAGHMARLAAAEEARRVREQHMQIVATEQRLREDPMSARARVALEFMRTHAENPMGVALAEVQRVLVHVTLAEARAVVEELAMMGLAYSTVDEDHFAATA